MSDILKKTVIAKKVEDYLRETSYSDLINYMPSDFALEFVLFIKLVEDGEPENKTPVVHYKFIDTIAKTGHTVNMCHRGFAKTTIFEYLMWYIAVYGDLPGFGKIPYALYVSDSMDNGVKKMRRSMENRWHSSKFLQQFVPKAKFTEGTWDFQNLDGNKFTVTGHGGQTGVRGVRENNSRPVLALLDDLISDTDAKSPTVIKRIEETIYNAIFAALHPDRRKIIWSGTPFNANDPLYKAVESPAWNVNVFPVCEDFPCKREEFRGSWEDRFSYESVLESYTMLSESGHLSAFNQEYMLRIMSDEDRLVTDSDICWYKRADLVTKKSNFNFYITTDFATGAAKHNDFSVISVWAYNNNGDWFWVDGICKKQLMNENIRDLFRFVTEYEPKSVGIEVSGQQGGFIDWIKDEMLSRNTWFTLASDNNSTKEGIRPTNNSRKIDRFHTILPMFKNKKMYFPKELRNSNEMVQFMDEITLVSGEGFKSKHDDFSDTISMLSQMKPYKPSAVEAMEKQADNVYGFSNNDSKRSGINSYLV